MCGILLQFSASGCNRQRFEEARDTMAHRGPDAAGSVFLQDGAVALGHRRLSIIDLSESANQPLSYRTVHIVYNGEIYNFRELRYDLERKGHVFRTHSDTEVLAAGYCEWGPSVCERLEGMFAFVVWDHERRKVFCARDHVGQKPLYYYCGKEMFAAASELPALRKLIETPLSVRWESIPELLYYGYVPEPHTWYSDIKALPPGHCMEVDFSGVGPAVRLREYWTYRPDPDPRPMTEREALDLIGVEIERAVKSHLVADVEVGAFLSGGVDSSCIAAVATSFLDRRLKTFCIGMGDDEVNEAPLARQTAEALGTDHYEQYEPLTNFRADAADALNLFGQPFADYSFVPTGRVARFARQYVKCALTGDGGDEVWGGYAHFPLHVRLPPWDWHSWRGIIRSAYLRIRGLRKWQQDFYVGHVMVTPEQVNATLSEAFLRKLGDYDVTWYVRKYWDERLDPFRRMQWIDIKTYLASDILVKVDRCAMRASLETRPPFLSHRLIEKVLNLPPEVKNPRGELKALFKKWLTGKVPDAVIRGRKRGFGIPPGQFPQADADPFRLSRCVEAGVVSRETVPAIGRLRLSSWIFEQIEAALDDNGTN